MWGQWWQPFLLYSYINTQIRWLYTTGTTSARDLRPLKLQAQPQAKVAILYQNDDLGQTYLKAFTDARGLEHQGMEDWLRAVITRALVRTALTQHNLPANCSNDRADECSTWTNSSKAAISIAK
jgi:hypothetical protein